TYVARASPKRLEAGDIPHGVGRGADVAHPLGARPTPRTGVSVVVGPALGHADSLEDTGREGETVRRVGRELPARRIVTGSVVVAVLQEVDVVTQTEQAHQVVKVLPHDPAERPPDDEAEDDDPQ